MIRPDTREVLVAIWVRMTGCIEGCYLVGVHSRACRTSLHTDHKCKQVYHSYTCSTRALHDCLLRLVPSCHVLLSSIAIRRDSIAYIPMYPLRSAPLHCVPYHPGPAHLLYTTASISHFRSKINDRPVVLTNVIMASIRLTCVRRICSVFPLSML